jgi:hypothetical protein
MTLPLDYSGADYIRIICGYCNDVRAVAGRDGKRASCPRCGTDEQRRDLFAKRALVPELRFSDMTTEEQELFREWRRHDWHELDCCRWIEGHRYRPEEDKPFLKEAFLRLAEWRDAHDENKPETEP